jgi:hypothetical protein
MIQKSEEATIKSAENVIRIMLLINGGAAVSVLAFVGSLASKDRQPADHLYAVAGSLVWFALGAASSGISAICSYLTNISYLIADKQLHSLSDPPYIWPTSKSKRWRLVGRITHGVAAFFVVVSLGLFVYGMFDVKNAIGHLGYVQYWSPRANELDWTPLPRSGAQHD